jgi:hypothetical protein
VSAHVASATKPTHVATSVVEPTHIATSVIELVHVVASASCIYVNLWHQLLGHHGVENLKSLVKQRVVDGFSIHKDTKLEFCKGCVLRK